MKRWGIVSCIFIQTVFLWVAVPWTFADSLKQSAPPPLPASFYGVLLAADESLSPRLTISAYINQEQVAQTTIFEHEGDWVYALKVPADNPATEEIEGGRPGDKIAFYINDRVVATAVWQGGINSQLDLTLESVVMAQTEAARPLALWLTLAAVTILILVVVIIRYRRFVGVFPRRQTNEQ